MTKYKKYPQTVLSVVVQSDKPIDIEAVRRKAGIKVWETAKALLLELLIEGKIRGQKTTKSWIFWAPKEETEVKFNE